MGASRAAEEEEEEWRVAALEKDGDVGNRKASMPGIRLRRRRETRMRRKGRRDVGVGGRCSGMMVEGMGTRDVVAWEGDRSWVEMLEVVASVVRVLGLVLGSCKGRT